MAHIQGVPAESAKRPAFTRAVEASEAGGLPGAYLVRLLARAPDQGEPLLHLLEVINRGGRVEPRLMRLMCVMLASLADDQYIAHVHSRAARADGIDLDLLDAARGLYDEDERLTSREKLALRFAEQMFLDHSRVDDSMYTELREHFTDPEIMEIGTVAGVNYALALIMGSLGATASDDGRG